MTWEGREGAVRSAQKDTELMTSGGRVSPNRKAAAFRPQREGREKGKGGGGAESDRCRHDLKGK